MGMPFAEVVEPRVVRAGARKEFFELSLMFMRMANEARARAAATLHGDLDDAKDLVAHVLAQQQTADLALSRASQLSPKTLAYRRRQKQMHQRNS